MMSENMKINNVDNNKSNIIIDSASWKKDIGINVTVCSRINGLSVKFNGDYADVIKEKINAILREDPLFTGSDRFVGLVEKIVLK